jgi:DNA polymerase III alpha subunit (gram-positive type)
LPRTSTVGLVIRSLVPSRMNVHGNDNILTTHLKCTSCKTQVFFKGIVQSEGCEVRLFGCPRCQSITSLRIQIPVGLDHSPDGIHVSDGHR